MGLLLPTVRVLDPLGGQDIVLGSILDVAVENRWLEANPVAKGKVPHNRAVQRRIYLTPQETKTIAGQMDEANPTIVYLLAYTGLRIGEARALRCRDANLSRNRINVLRHPVGRCQLPSGGDPAEGQQDQVRRYPASCCPESKPCWKVMARGVSAARALGRKAEHRELANRVRAPALQDAGMHDIEGLVIHSLRHAYASLAIKADADVKTLQAVLGHASATEAPGHPRGFMANCTGEVAEVIGQDIRI